MATRIAKAKTAVSLGNALLNISIVFLDYEVDATVLIAVYHSIIDHRE